MSDRIYEIETLKQWTGEARLLNPDIDKVLKSLEANKARDAIDGYLKRGIPVLDISKGLRIVRAWRQNELYPLYFDAPKDSETVVDLSSGVNAGILSGIEVDTTQIDQIIYGETFSSRLLDCEVSIVRVNDISDIPVCAYSKLLERLGRPLAQLVIPERPISLA